MAWPKGKPNPRKGQPRKAAVPALTHAAAGGTINHDEDHQMNQAQQSNEKATPEMWTVLDTNARGTPRHHDVVTRTDAKGFPAETRRYTLDSQKPAAMVKDHAMTFLRDPAFIVMNAEGKRMTPITRPKTDSGAYTPPPGYTIAAWDELSTDALYARCKIYPQSAAINEASSRAEMGAFLEAMARPAVGRSRGSENVIGELRDADQLIDLSEFVV